MAALILEIDADADVNVAVVVVPGLRPCESRDNKQRDKICRSLA